MTMTESQHQYAEGQERRYLDNLVEVLGDGKEAQVLAKLDELPTLLERATGHER